MLTGDLFSLKQPASSRPNFGNTVQRFLVDGAADGGASSPLAMLAKASALYDRANYLSEHLDIGTSPINSVPLIIKNNSTTGVNDTVQAFDNAIEIFKQSLPSVERASSFSEDQMHSLMLIYCLVHCAIIQLHRGLITMNSASLGRCMASANSVLAQSVVTR